MNIDFLIFPNKKFPSEKHIACGNSIEANDVENFFRERYRDEITFDSLKSGYPHDPAACLTFMQPEAFAFFLPSYLRIALDDYEISDAIPGSVIFDLLRMAQGEYGHQLDAILSSYSPEQLTVVAEFLAEMSKRYWHLYPSDDAKKALSLYWGQYAKLTN